MLCDVTHSFAFTWGPGAAEFMWNPVEGPGAEDAELDWGAGVFAPEVFAASDTAVPQVSSWPAKGL